MGYLIRRKFQELLVSNVQQYKRPMYKKSLKVHLSKEKIRLQHLTTKRLLEKKNTQPTPLYLQTALPKEKQRYKSQDRAIKYSQQEPKRDPLSSQEES